MVRVALLATILSLPLGASGGPVGPRVVQQPAPPPSTSSVPPASAPAAAPADPRQGVAPAAELLGRYDLDGDARDATRRGPDGDVKGARPAEDRTGNPAGALAFGGKDYVDLGLRIEPERFSIAMWIRPARLGRDAALFSKWSAVKRPRDRWLELRVEADGRVALQTPTTDPADVVRTARPVERGRWTHVAATYDGQRGAIYLDGRLEADGELAAFDATRGPVFLGARPDASGRRRVPFASFEGRLDQVMLYRGPLAAAEAAALAETPQPGSGPADEDDAHEVVRTTKMLASFEAACARRDPQLVTKAERRALEEIEAQLRDARADRERAQRLRRATQDLASVRGRFDAKSLDRARSILAELSEAAWLALVEEIDGEPWTRPARYDDRRDSDWR